MSTPVCWHKMPHGNPVTRDPRYVTHYGCLTETSFLGTVIGGAARAALRAIADRPSTWLNVIRALLVTPAPVQRCGATMTEASGFRWVCGWPAHDGDEHGDLAYGAWREL